MRDDQRIRGLGAVVLGIAYVSRVIVVGNGAIRFLQYELSPFALLVIAVVMLALPETIESLPFGPTRQS